ncbi:fusion protein [Dysgonomonas sp. 25]|uniref:fusion protein n=1 Tax=Dysgonomonas sp. 25 TaxID=2302933 RepID=UPI0013D87B1F|nr:fusion protein [Dysgonomonas sp. 25]NDV70379.1 fusion protein [Dysgonomonas sp. 25]
MNKVFLLGANKEIDRAKQVVEVNQIIQMEGYSYHRYVVYDIVVNQWGITYKLINLTTKDFHTANIIRPLKEKFGIGFYYDSKNPQFMDGFEVAILLQEAEQKKKAEADEEEKERIRVEEVKTIGRKRFAEIFPEDAQAVIVARLRQNESDSPTDYFAHSPQRTVILGFSKHKRELFSEMRKHASNFEEIAYLAEYNEDYEHREKYSMGDGYYLGESKYHGWIIEKCPIYKREKTIEEFAYTAGNEDNIHLKSLNENNNPTSTETAITNENLSFEIVDYSEKAIALFGDTKAIKDLLSAMGGKFNPRLNYNNQKHAGWIFSKTKQDELNTVLNLKAE